MKSQWSCNNWTLHMNDLLYYMNGYVESSSIIMILYIVIMVRQLETTRIWLLILFITLSQHMMILCIPLFAPSLLFLCCHGNVAYLLELGVKTEAEKRSFIFDSRKGLEPILFDISDPTLLANVVYRIMQIRFDLDRTFFGTVVNMAGTYE